MARVDQMLFPGGKKKAFTMSYDDGVVQDRQLLSIMKQYGIKGTFNLNSGLMGRIERTILDGIDTDISTIPAQEAVNLYQGNEIAAHGLNHMGLVLTDIGAITYEVAADRRNLENIFDTIIKGFAYPFGAYDEQTIQALKACGIQYARTVHATYDFGLPDNFLKWHPTCHHNDPRLMDLLVRFCTMEMPYYTPQLFFLWGHSYEFEQKNNWEVIEKALEYAGRYTDIIWMASNGEIVRYMQDYSRLQYSADNSLIFNPSSQSIWLSTGATEVCIPSGKTVKL